MKRKTIVFMSLLMSLILLVSILSGCGGGNKGGDGGGASGGGGTSESTSGGGEQITITVLLPEHEADQKGFITEETRKFEEETGIKVEMVRMGWMNVADRVMAELTSGGTTFDVIEFDNAWVAKFVANDWVVPLNDYMTPDMWDGISPSLIKKFSSPDGQLYGIVWLNEVRSFMYNKAMLEAAGYNEPPKTWAQLKEQSLNMMDMGLCKYGTMDSFVWINGATFMTYSFGGDFIDKDGNITIATDPGVKAAYDYLADGMLVSKHWDPASVLADGETIGNTFCMGNIPFLPNAWPGVYEMANDPATSNIVGDCAVAPWVVSVDGTITEPLTLPEAMAIPTTSKNKDAAWEYIKYISSYDVEKRKAIAIGALPIWTELYNDPDLLAIYPHWEIFGKLLLTARGLIDVEWIDEFAVICERETQNIMLGNVSVDEGLRTMHDEVEAIAK